MSENASLRNIKSMRKTENVERFYPYTFHLRFTSLLAAFNIKISN